MVINLIQRKNKTGFKKMAVRALWAVTKDFYGRIICTIQTICASVYLCFTVITQVYINHFGWQMQHRLQALINVDYDGELLVGQAAIIKTLSPDDKKDAFENPKFNEGKLIKYLISAPTMRVPMDVIHSVNAYLAFRAVIRAGKYTQLFIGLTVTGI